MHNKVPYEETNVIDQGLTWFRVVMSKKLVWRSGVVRGTYLTTFFFMIGLSAMS